MRRLMRCIAAGLVLCLALTLVKNEYGRVLTRNASSGLEALITWYGQARERGEDPSLQLFIGSSMFRQGLDIDVLQDALGEDVYLLTYNGTQPFLMYEELDYLLERGVEIDCLYLDMFPNSTWGEPWVQDEKVFLDTDFDFKRRLWSVMGKSGGADFSAFWEMFVTANNERLLAWPVDFALTDGMFRRGGSLLVNTGIGEETLMAQKGDPDLPGAMNETQAGYIGKILSRCAAEDIPVLYIETPKYFHVMEERAYQDVMERYARIILEGGARCLLDSVTFDHLEKERGIDLGDTWTYDFDTRAPGRYIDVIHLSSEGRRIFTETVAERLAAFSGQQGNPRQ